MPATSHTSKRAATIATDTFRHYFFSFGPTTSIAFFEYIGRTSQMVSKPAGAVISAGGFRAPWISSAR